MLQLKQIVKDYAAGSTVVHALKGIDLQFRESEFVAVLGHSGCGKTTLLNIIGGLDQYTSGDLVINGKSTKDFTDGDWDTYRNHSVGFVFQNYNLIPHQSVLQNVELALTIGGIPASERTARATEALIKVGLEEHIHKKPSQLSGGQMQRVAIARALVNDPQILLADEPTGALDSDTSLQVMDLLKEVAEDRLVVMVTHNPELAEQYARPYRKTGFFLYGNHTRVSGDAYTPALITFPKKAYIVANPDSVSIPGIRHLVEDLGTVPISSDIAGMKVGYQAETTSDFYAKKHAAEEGFTYIENAYDKVMNAYDDLKLKRIDVVVSDGLVAVDYLAPKDTEFKQVWSGTPDEYFGICMKKGNTELQTKVNKILEDMKADGTLKNIYVKIFGMDLSDSIK